VAKNVHFIKLDNNRVGENINPKSKILSLPNTRLMHICDKNNIKCPPKNLEFLGRKEKTTCNQIVDKQTNKQTKTNKYI
jgi:hypothetical protein